ncbi:MAG TPA: ATP-binding protein [Burkholderiaceae bacterium]|nr:ATP-binding protein [Burkholderiaceae bacterium]
MTSGLRRRLLVLLLVPLCLLALLSAWFDYRQADSAAIQQDRQLELMARMLANSVVAPGREAGDPPLLLLAPPFAEFLSERAGFAAYAITDLGGQRLHGEPWLATPRAASREPAFNSEDTGGVTYRIATQRVQTAAGELVMLVADGSDPRQQWVRAVLLKVVLPNLILIVAAAFAVNWAVRRALRPLFELKDVLERRSPRDLSAIDEQASPEEVRPLVHSLNRLFGLVNAQAESQRRFVADAAHQLRTPLAGLQAQVEAWAQAANIRRGPGSAGAAAPPGEDSLVLKAEQINKLRSATRRTSQLANQLLALSRADARSMEGQPIQHVDLKDLCEAMLELHLDAATAKHIDLGQDVAPVQAMGHHWLLRELLGNLVDNAVKYTPPGGTVTIRCGMRGEAPFLEVEDDGPGVAPLERPRVLERFYRVPGTSGEGNGLGLAIADEIARLHHAQLQLEPGAQGRGLRVTLVLAG